MSKKTHKSMTDAAWLARMKTFAESGVWPQHLGNRPAPRQKKWHDMYKKVHIFLH